MELKAKKGYWNMVLALEANVAPNQLSFLSVIPAEAKKEIECQLDEIDELKAKVDSGIQHFNETVQEAWEQLYSEHENLETACSDLENLRDFVYRELRSWIESERKRRISPIDWDDPVLEAFEAWIEEWDGGCSVDDLHEEFHVDELSVEIPNTALVFSPNKILRQAEIQLKIRAKREELRKLESSLEFIDE